MTADVVLLPALLEAGQLTGRSCVVFDVLRATTTMTAALAAGVREIRLFATLDAARAAAESFTGPRRLLCGESACLPPPGFDLGNSPGQFAAAAHRDATVFMCTTNGTAALLAARGAAALYTGALVNASAVARQLRADGRDVVLLCAGTNRAVAMEDVIGAGAVLDALNAAPATDVARIALNLFRASRDRLDQVFRDAEGGRNVLAAGLPQDIDFAARLDALEVVGVAAGDPLVVRAAAAASADRFQ